MSEYTRNLAILLCSLTVLFLSMIAMIACCHDNRIMQKNNDRMRQTIVEMIEQQEHQASEIRQVKTDTEIILRLLLRMFILKKKMEVKNDFSRKKMFFK